MTLEKQIITVSGKYFGPTPFVLSHRYSDLKEIGSGSFGVVVKAFDSETQKPVAIKKLLSVFEMGPREGLHLIRELRLMRLLKHENILSLIDIEEPWSYEEFSDLYIIMPLMDTDLFKVLHTTTNIPPIKVKWILYQVLCALNYMHSAGVVHRDIKPQNIMINKDYHACVGDLGLARQMEENDPTGTKDICTKIYRAPEVFFGDSYSSPIDIWSFGALVGEMYTREPIFRHKNMKNSQLEEILRVIGTPDDAETAHIKDKAGKWFLSRLPKYQKVSIKETFSKYDPDAVDIMEQCLHFDPGRRPTAAKLLEHKYFDEVRIKEKEIIDDKNIAQMELEPDIEKKLTKPILRRLAWEEMLNYHPESSSKLPPETELKNSLFKKVFVNGW